MRWTRPLLTFMDPWSLNVAVLEPELRIRIRGPVPFWPLDPGSGIGFFQIPDLGSRIPNPYFWEHSDNFLSKKLYDSLKIGPKIFFLIISKLNNFKFCEICGYKKKYDNKFCFTPLFCCCFWIRDPRSGIRDPGSEIRDPGSEIRDSRSGIRDG
jgi:hypothetical protein